MKTCTRCGEEKPVGAFRRDDRYKDGRASWCISCKREHKREWKKRRREEMDAQLCPQCQEPFKPDPWSIQTYCSRRCRGFAIKRSGGRYVGQNGYVLLLVGRGHPVALPSRPYALEHRVVMSEMLGRWLERHEIVHHINRDRSDNRPANLQLCSSASEHARLHKLGVR